MKHFFLFILATFVLTGCNKDDNTTQTSEELTLATIFIDPISNIKGDIANTGGDIVDDGGSSIILKGICWSTSPNPTIDDNTDNSGPGMSEFTGQITNIDFNTTYYVRAYATNTTGVAYSEELSFMSTNDCTINVFEGDVKLTTQSEVDAFGLNGYCKITGDLVVEEPKNAASDFIVDLTPLNNLRYIGRLWITDNTHLEDLQGLNNVSFIFDSVNIDRNRTLDNMDALSTVSSEMTSISVTRNNQLRNINGLAGITALIPPTGYSNPPYAFIIQNSVLENIDGLNGITAVESNTEIGISGSPLLSNLNGLENILGTIGKLQLVELPQLTDILGVTGIQSVTDELSIFQCDALTNLDGLHNISFVGNEFNISFNDGLSTLDGLSSLTKVQGNFILRHNSLTDFCGLQNLFNSEGVGGAFIVELNTYNPSEQDIIDGNCSL